MYHQNKSTNSNNIKITVTEDAPTDIGLDMIIPCSVTMRGYDTEITVEKNCEPIARRAAELYGEDLTSTAAREYILSELFLALEGSGYTPSREAITDSTVTYLANSAEQIRTDCITEDTRAIAPNCIEKYDNLTGYEPNEISRADGSETMPIFAVIVNEKILSLAAVEEITQGCAEISVETAEGYTGRGYAASCVCALTGYLISRGMHVKYVTFESNAPSLAVAEKTGFIRKSLSYDAVCFADEE